ncbi:MAG: hypothetical protein CME59_16670 [Halioglobus sp.]|nr:hypothetical protein [Halioglobus sp.]|tara:strand:- start:5156 stop:5632 length:477 start_codon:yes stop_codon:yes gene_type:complete
MVKLERIEDILDQVQDTVEHLVAVGNRLLPDARILHIGSSSIPGALTKGDVDILVQVDNNEFAQARGTLDAHFAHNPEMEPEELFVSYSGGFRGTDYGLQLVGENENGFGFIALQQALLANPALVERYNEVKLSACNGSMDTYRAAKTEFIEGVLGGT